MTSSAPLPRPRCNNVCPAHLCGRLGSRMLKWTDSVTRPTCGCSADKTFETFLESKNSSTMPIPQIVILGGGFAGVAVARRLEARLRDREASITLVSRDNFTLFTPMLPEVCSGGIETRHIVSPVRGQLRRTQYVLGLSLIHI